MEKKYTNLVETNEKLGRDIKDLERARDNLKKEIERIKSEYEEEINKLNDDIKKYILDIDDLKNNLNELETQIENYKRK